MRRALMLVALNSTTLPTRSCGWFWRGRSRRFILLRPRSTAAKEVASVADQETIDQLRKDRGRVYGPPKENHIGIAQIWASLLQPHWKRIRRTIPVPPHVVAQLMMGLKLNRMRLTHHKDNYDDLAVYARFAEEWQAEWERDREADLTAEQVQDLRTERIYIAGPYSNPDREEVKKNVDDAIDHSMVVMAKGHHVYCPHAATHGIDVLVGEQRLDGTWMFGGDFSYERWLRQCLDMIERWATAVFIYDESPGALREVEFAKSLNLTIYRSLDEIPDLRTHANNQGTAAGT